MFEISSQEFFPIFTFIQETVISELDEEKGNFLCGPEWKVKITTKAGQDLDIKQVILLHFKLVLDIDLNSFFYVQIEDGPDFRVLISPLPPKVEEEVKKVEKVVVKKKNDNRFHNRKKFKLFFNLLTVQVFIQWG